MLWLPDWAVSAVDRDDDDLTVLFVESLQPYNFAALQGSNLPDPKPEMLTFGKSFVDSELLCENLCVGWVRPKEKMCDKEHSKAFRSCCITCHFCFLDIGGLEFVPLICQADVGGAIEADEVNFQALLTLFAAMGIDFEVLQPHLEHVGWSKSFCHG
jgi:hypothetical protein